MTEPEVCPTCETTYGDCIVCAPQEDDPTVQHEPVTLE